VIKKERKVRLTPLVQEHTPGPSTQFKSTPRFTFPSTPRPIASQSLPRTTPSATRYLTPASKTPKEQDVIESVPDEVLPDVHDSIETEDQEIDQEYLFADEYDDCKIEEPALKRRRISLSPDPGDEEDDQKEEELPLHTQDSISSSLLILSSPPAPRRPTTASRFLTSAPAPPATPQPSTFKQATFLKPPRFRPPDPSETAQAASDPLPEQFSPHRKGQIYEPGGLAAEVRDWLVNIESTIPSKELGNKVDDEWLTKIVIDEVSGGSSRVGARMMLIRGRRVHSLGNEGVDMVATMGEVRMMLAGEGQGSGLQKGGKVELGKTVGIKGPVWEVVIERTKWGVGVDWKVLP